MNLVHMMGNKDMMGDKETLQSITATKSVQKQMHRIAMTGQSEQFSAAD